MYFNGVLVGSATSPTVHMPLKVTDRVIYIGRPTNDNLQGRYANGVVDELDYWYAGRGQLQSLGLLDDGENFSLVEPSQWLKCFKGAGIAPDASDPGSTPGALEFDAFFRGSVKCVAISKQWVSAVEDCGCKLYRVYQVCVSVFLGVALP